LSSIARRYVEPLFEVALERNQLDRIAEELAALDQAINVSQDLRKYIFDPSIERHVKKSVMEQIFAGASDYTLNFIKLVIEKNRPEILSMAYRLYINLLNDHRGITPGEVETAVPLDDVTFDGIRKDLEARFNTKLHLERKVDSDLLGGMRVRIGNMVIDGSVRGRLVQLRELLIR